MRKLLGLILVNLSRFSTMNIRNPPISAIAIRSPPSTAVFISEISIVLQNNLQLTASSIIKQDSVIGETSKLLSEMANDIQVTDTVCKISENPEVHTNDEANLQNILQGKEANTPLVESEPFVEFQSILQKNNKYDSCTNEQNSPSKLVLNDSLAEDLLYEETKCHIVIKESETIVSNLQINKQNSLLSKWKPVSKKKEVLPGYMLEKVTNIIQLVYKNNEILTINQAICPFGNMHCQESGIDVNIGHKCSIQIPLLKSRHNKAPYTYKQQFKSENKSKVKTLVKNNYKRGVKTKEPHRKKNNNKPSEQKISVDKESVDNVRCDIVPERKSTVNSLLDKIDTRTSSKKNMMSKNSSNKTKLNRQNYQKQPDKTQTTVSSETQINLKKVSNKASKKVHVGTEQSSENNLAGPKTESWYSSDVKRRFKVARQKPKSNLNSQCSNRMQEKLIRTKKGSTKFNERAESRSSIPTCSVLSTPEDGRPDPDGQSMDNFISKLSLDVLMELPSAEEFGLYDLTDLFSGRLEQVYEKWKKREQYHLKKKSASFSDDKREKRKPPNYFVAIQITNPEITERIDDVQRCMCNSNKDLKSAMITLSTLHLTLRVSCLENQEHINRMIQALDQCIERFNKEDGDNDMILLDVNDIGHFHNSVVFAKVQEDGCLSKIVKLSEILEQCCQENDVPPSDGKGFTPHITIAKLSKVSFQVKKKVKKIEPSSYAEFQHYHFGKQLVTNLQLCSMNKPKDKAGYYHVTHVTRGIRQRQYSTFSRQAFTVSDVAHILVTTALSNALYDLNGPNSKTNDGKQVNSNE